MCKSVQNNNIKKNEQMQTPEESQQGIKSKMKEEILKRRDKEVKEALNEVLDASAILKAKKQRVEEIYNDYAVQIEDIDNV